jgi:hypothetical protein
MNNFHTELVHGIGRTVKSGKGRRAAPVVTMRAPEIYTVSPR